MQYFTSNKQFRGDIVCLCYLSFKILDTFDLLTDINAIARRPPLFPFIILGAILEGVGAGESMIRIAFSLMKKTAGGPAHAAILASGIFVALREADQKVPPGAKQVAGRR